MTARLLLAALLCLEIAGAAWASPLLPCVRQVDYVVQTLSGETVSRESKTLFVLYVGNAETERNDRLAEHLGITRVTSLVHPAPVDRGAGVPSGMAARSARGGWYMTEVDSRMCCFRAGPLMTREVWRTVPVLARLACVALGPDDENLVLIAWNAFSGSLSIYFAPAVQENRAFFQRKLEMLRDYLEAHGDESDVPFERVDPAGPAGEATSS